MSAKSRKGQWIKKMSDEELKAASLAGDITKEEAEAEEARRAKADTDNADADEAKKKDKKSKKAKARKKKSKKAKARKKKSKKRSRFLVPVIAGLGLTGLALLLKKIISGGKADGDLPMLPPPDVK